MNMRKWFGLLLVLMLAFVLAACGGGDDDGDGGDGGDGGDNADTSGVELPQSITSEDPNFGGSLTVNYPEGWVAQDAGGSVILADSQESLDASSSVDLDPSTLGDDAVFVNISALGPDMVGIMVTGEEEVTPSSLLNSMLVEGMATQEGVEVGEIQEETINGRNAATVVASGGTEGQEARIFAVAVEVNDGFVLMLAGSAPDADASDDEVRAIAGAVEATFGSIDLGGADATEEMPMDEEVPADATEEPAG